MADTEDGALFGEDTNVKEDSEKADVKQEEGKPKEEDGGESPKTDKEKVDEKIIKEDENEEIVKKEESEKTIKTEEEEVQPPIEPEKPKKKKQEEKSVIKPSPPRVPKKTPRPSINSSMSDNAKLNAEKNPYSTHRKRSKWEPIPVVHPEDICYIPNKKLSQVPETVAGFRCLLGTLPRPAIWCIGRYNNLVPEKRLRAMKLMSKGIGTAVQFGDGVLIDGGVDWCAGDVKFPKEIRTAFPLLGISNHHQEYNPPEGLHWGHDQHVIFHCHDEDFPRAAQNIIDAITGIRKCKCVVIVIGGDPELDLPLVEAANEYGYPIILLEGTGGLADELVDMYKAGNSTNEWPRTTMGKIVKNGYIKVFESDDFEDEGELTALIHICMVTNIFDYESWEGRYGPPQ